MEGDEVLSERRPDSNNRGARTVDQSSGVWEATSGSGILMDVGSSPQEVSVHGTGRTARRRSLRSERGQALVEFVLLLPVFLLITFGLIEFGKGFNYWIDVTHLANEGARYAAVNRWPSCPADDTSACSEQLRKYVQERANTSELALGGANVEGTGLSYTTPPAANDGIVVCFPEDASPATGEAVRVVVRAKYKLAVVDGLLSFIGLDNVGVLDLSGSSTMRLERTPTANRLLVEDSAACPS
jgi:Flp pilus assembly protein TadG